MTHIVLFGDSIFDNQPYVPEGQAVIHQLRTKFPPDSTATLLAVDGAIARDIPSQFRKHYAAALERLCAAHLPLTVCTIYHPCFERREEQIVAQTALTFWNDVITSEALQRNLPMIDLRPMFNSPQDYANPIEPSVQGGQKLTDRIVALVFGESPVES
ncbi:hypothetical protein RYO59_001667 [Thermosynechococcaceae cyanobacterium Okahandja]